MTLLLNTLSNAINQIAKSVQLSTLLPAAIFLLINILYIFPAIGVIVEENAPLQISLLILAIVGFSYILWLLNPRFIELLEGYPFLHEKFGQKWIKKQKDRLEIIRKGLEQCHEQLDLADHWLNTILPARYHQNPDGLFNDDNYLRIKSRQAQWNLIKSRLMAEYHNHFPPDPEYILPTRLGNTIAAFDSYPEIRYGIDGPTLMPRLTPILDKNGFSIYIQHEKSAFDFLLNIFVILCMLIFECLVLFLMQFELKWFIASLIALPFLVMAYYTLIDNAVIWGDTVKVAFDLYRHDLRKALLINIPNSLEEERNQWQQVSSFLAVNEEALPEVWNYPALHKTEETGEEQ